MFKNKAAWMINIVSNQDENTEYTTVCASDTDLSNLIDNYDSDKYSIVAIFPVSGFVDDHKMFFRGNLGLEFGS